MKSNDLLSLILILDKTSTENILIFLLLTVGFFSIATLGVSKRKFIKILIYPLS